MAMDASESPSGPPVLASVLAVLAAHNPELASEFGVTELAVFGSVARAEARPDSDVDVLVDFDPAVGVGLFELVELQGRLAQLLGRRVDLVMREGVRRQLRDRILGEAVRVA